MQFARKILIGLVALTLIVGAYVMYSRSSKTPTIKIGGGADVNDINVPTFDGRGGRIGPATVDVLRGTTYIHRDAKTKQIDREFGFAELVRTFGDTWEVDKPWMKVYQKDFQLDITADLGTTEIETVVGSSTPKDAIFQGNVTIRILPLEQTKYRETTILLDNLIFLSDKSQFSTPGPVKLVSEDMNMDGRGLEFVYNDQTEQLDYLRLQRLDSMRIRSSAAAAVSKLDSKPSEQGPAPQADSAVSAPQPALDDSAKKPPAGTTTTPAETAQPGQPKYYKCILSENVVVDTPDEVIFARGEVCINDIMLSTTPASEDANNPPETGAANIERKAGTAIETSGPKPNPPTAPTEQAVEVVVTCDNGILIVPMDSKRAPADFPRAQPDNLRGAGYRPAALDDPNGRSTFLTERIDYNSVSGDAIAAGPAELVFYTGGMMTLEPNETSVPVTVTATEAVHLVKQSNQAIFNGDCLLKMPQQGLLQQRDVTLTASQFTVNMPTDTSAGTRTPGDVVAAGPVELVFYVEDSNAAATNEPPAPVSITAQRQAVFIPDSNQVIFDVNCVCTMHSTALPSKRDFTLTSPRFIANLPKQTDKKARGVPDVIALGPVQLTSFVDAFDSNEPNAAPLPATVTAAKQARFLPAANQVLFEGDSKAVVLREDPNFVEHYILSSQKITVDLPADGNERPSKSNLGIEHLTASGGVVTLATKKMAGDKQLSGIELISRRFDYDPNEELFTAAGPAEIWLDNSHLVEGPNDANGAFSLKRPCWARIQNFDSLKYFKSRNLIIADAASDGPIVVRYIPIKNGKLGDVRIVTANHVEADLVETPAGGAELATLVASSGITYQAEGREFIGGRLLYDHARQWMKITGSESFPCMANGMLADEIEYDLKTDTIRAEVVGPGELRLK